jgi:hypothetical protein
MLNFVCSNVGERVNRNIIWLVSEKVTCKCHLSVCAGTEVVNVGRVCALCRCCWVGVAQAKDVSVEAVCQVHRILSTCLD